MGDLSNNRFMRCVVCFSTDLHVFEKYSSLRRVTSDAKPWPEGGELVLCKQCALVQKVVDDYWLKEIDNIYKNYDKIVISNMIIINL